MVEIRANHIVAILQATGVVPSEVLDKINNLILADPNILLLEKLVETNILDEYSANKVRELWFLLEKHFSQHLGDQKIALHKLDKISSINISDEMKKDILFARQVLADGICKIEDVNRSFEEQANIKKSSGRNLLLGQIMVKNHYIAVDRFVQIHRDIESHVKTADWSRVFAQEKKIRLTFQDGIIKFMEGNIPQKFGTYQILEEVARGGMGVVYKAWDDKLHRVVALKVLKDWENPPEDEIRRFHREARLAASLHHPSIVSIYDSGIVDNVHYFTMDFVEGQTLSGYLKGVRRDFQQELAIIREIALALHYAHTNDVVHRDVKPDNIILDRNNHPLLTDFGLAKGMNNLDSRRLTQSGEALGTPAYMSPEQARGTNVDVRSDIYSLGAVLYEILVGRPPFQGEAVMNIISAILSQDPVHPSKLNPKVHKDIETICLKALARNPQNRYQTAKEMADDIELFLHGKNIRSKPASFLGRFLYQIRTNLGTLTPFIVLFLILFSLTAWFGGKIYFAYLASIKHYDLAIRAIGECDYKKAWAYLEVAGQHPYIYPMVLKKKQEISQYFYEEASEKMEFFARASITLQEQYNKELQRFEKTKEPTNKKDALLALQDFKDLQDKNTSNLVAARSDYLQSLFWDQSHPYSQEKLWEIDEKYLCSQDMVRYIKGLQPCAKLTIASEPTDANVFLFFWDELYLRKIPIPNTSLKLWMKQDGRIPTPYFDVTRVAIESSNCDGHTPCEISIYKPGYYTVLIQKENYQNSQQIIKIDRNDSLAISVTLFPRKKELDGFVSVHFSSPDSKLSYYMSNEITVAQYLEFLNDPATISQYKKAQDSGQVILVPRYNGSSLWNWDGKKFFTLEKNESPVCAISWQDTQSYCQWLSQKHKANKIRYRLPTRKEWQWTFGEVDGRIYPWGNVFDPWFAGINSKESPFDISPYMLENMMGSLAEWSDTTLRPAFVKNDAKSGDKNMWAIVCGTHQKYITADTARIEYFQQQYTHETSKEIGFRILAIVPLD